jgi:hypothetical protein
MTVRTYVKWTRILSRAICKFNFIPVACSIHHVQDGIRPDLIEWQFVILEVVDLSVSSSVEGIILRIIPFYWESIDLATVKFWSPLTDLSWESLTDPFAISLARCVFSMYKDSNCKLYWFQKTIPVSSPSLHDRPLLIVDEDYITCEVLQSELNIGRMFTVGLLQTLVTL